MRCTRASLFENVRRKFITFELLNYASSRAASDKQKFKDLEALVRTVAELAGSSKELHPDVIEIEM